MNTRALPTRPQALVALSLPLILAAACGAPVDSDDDDDVLGADAGLVDEVLVNGLPASEFYGQFVWEESGGNLSGAAAFPETDGRDAFKLDFFLMADKSFSLFYGEGFGEVTTTGHSLNLYPDSYSRRDGTWRVDGADLVLGTVARCGGLSFNDNDVLQCELTESIVSAAAQGASGIMKLRIDTSPFDSEWAEYE